MLGCEVLRQYNYVSHMQPNGSASQRGAVVQHRIAQLHVRFRECPTYDTSLNSKVQNANNTLCLLPNSDTRYGSAASAPGPIADSTP